LLLAEGFYIAVQDFVVTKKTAAGKHPAAVAAKRVSVYGSTTESIT
jgi:hypothetical protein